ncbi:MAG: hypothetical protein ACLU0O_09000 [Collinsella sp.]
MKIVILLCVLIFAISYIQSHFRPSAAADHGPLQGHLGKWWSTAGNGDAVLQLQLDPAVHRFTRAGLPWASPSASSSARPWWTWAAGADHEHLRPGVAVAYTVVGLLIAIAGGTIIQRMGMEEHLADFVRGDAGGRRARP